MVRLAALVVVQLLRIAMMVAAAVAALEALVLQGRMILEVLDLQRMMMLVASAGLLMVVATLRVVMAATMVVSAWHAPLAAQPVMASPVLLQLDFLQHVNSGHQRLCC
jgi:hypothetical protein